jgi:phosphoglycolate phosphatase
MHNLNLKTEQNILNTDLTHSLSSAKTKLVITDVDGTMASFWDYFVPAIRDFMREMSGRSNRSINELAQDIGHVIERRGTHEYPWLLEETEFAWSYYVDEPQEFIENFVKPFWAAVDENRAKYLRPYPQVLETLTKLKERGIKIVALSDAPEYMARVRNKQIFDGLLDAVYSLETKEPAEDDVYQPIEFTHGRSRVRQLRAETADLTTPLHILPQSYEKPCTDGIDRVLADFEVYPAEVVFIGDSLNKDGLVAASRGIRFVWAHYGISLPAEYEELVNYSLKPAGATPIQQRRMPQHLISAVAARYDELLNIV